MARRYGNVPNIPSLQRVIDNPRHYHAHINEDQPISVNTVYDINRSIETVATSAAAAAATIKQQILSVPPLFDSIKCQTRLISSYFIEKQIGQGGYGKVFKGVDKRTNKIVAIKQMDKRKERNGFSQNALREIKLLREIYHHNSVLLLQIVVGDDQNNLDDIRKNPMYLIYEYIDHDLAGVLKRKKKLPQDLVRCYTFQLLNVLEYLHSKNIMHRDLKLSNILVTNNNKIKLCDFGLARKESILLRSCDRTYTNNVITLWYRPPELLLGATNYDASVDMWSVGCILGELLLGKVLFKGATHMRGDSKMVDQIRTKCSQLDKIWNITGSPTLSSWPNHNVLPEYKEITKATKKLYNSSNSIIKSTMEEKWEHAMSYDAYDAVKRMLVLNPRNRLRASQAKKASFFNPRRGGFDENLLLPETFPKLFQEGSSNHEWEIRHGSKNALGVAAAAATATAISSSSSSSTSKNGNNTDNSNSYMNQNRSLQHNHHHHHQQQHYNRTSNNKNNYNHSQVAVSSSRGSLRHGNDHGPPEAGYRGNKGHYNRRDGDRHRNNNYDRHGAEKEPVSKPIRNNKVDDTGNRSNVDNMHRGNEYSSNRGPPRGPPPPRRNPAPPPSAPPPQQQRYSNNNGNSQRWMENDDRRDNYGYNRGGRDNGPARGRDDYSRREDDRRGDGRHNNRRRDNAGKRGRGDNGHRRRGSNNYNNNSKRKRRWEEPGN